MDWILRWTKNITSFIIRYVIHIVVNNRPSIPLSLFLTFVSSSSSFPFPIIIKINTYSSVRIYFTQYYTTLRTNYISQNNNKLFIYSQYQYHRIIIIIIIDIIKISQYGGVHWSRNEELYWKHVDEYKKCTATVFKECNLFVIWGMIVAKDYDGLTDHFVQYEEDEEKRLGKTELAQLLKERLQCTTWSY